IFDVTEAIPDEPTDIQLVVQNPCPALGVSVDGARAPSSTERAGNAFSIQVLGDLLRRDARNEVAKDPLDDGRLGWVDFAFAGGHGSAVDRLDDAVAVAQAA